MDTSEYREIPIDQIQESPDNPRKTFDDTALQELAASIRARGILAPVIVRPVNGHFELIAGTRRVRAARLVGLDVVPAFVRERPDAEVLDDAITENLQRENVTPLEEARAFARALEQRDETKTRVERVVAIAASIGKSPTYVWDRLKLVDLIPDAQALLDRGLITVRHAVPLARLTPDQQKKAIDPHTGGSFEPEESLDLYGDRLEAVKRDRWAGLKAKSVRELEAWIAEHVRFDVKQAATAAPLDFGPVAEQVQEASERPGRGKKVVHITHDSFVKPDARSNERTYCRASWKLADGSDKKAPTCDRSVLGLVVVGPDYGKSYEVCVNKDCDVHWAKEKREREKRAASGRGESPTAAAKRREEEDRRYQEKQRREDEARKAWEKARPALTVAVADAVLKMKPLALADLILRQLEDPYRGITRKVADKHLGAVKTADDLGRHAALLTLMRRLHEWNACETFPKVAAAVGVNVAAVLEQQAPKPAASVDGRAAKGKKGSKTPPAKKGGKKR